MSENISTTDSHVTKETLKEKDDKFKLKGEYLPQMFALH